MKNIKTTQWVFDGVWAGGNTWFTPGYINVDDSGNVLECGAVTDSSAAVKHKTVHKCEGYALPGLVNGHSHAFQYAMAGMAENIARFGGGSGGYIDDDFWTWREMMYGLANSLSPDAVKAIAIKLFRELLKSGYTHVVEFQYLHHDLGGKAYARPSEMSLSLLAAAKEAGIGITLVPILYEQSTFGKKAQPTQLRFLHQGLDEFIKLFEGLRADIASDSSWRLGIGAHSLRAVHPDHIKALWAFAKADVPFHIHAAEQMLEVDQCVAALGSRPVAWILEHLKPDHRCNLVHATHLDRSEIETLAASGANVVLCPTTEANLGDGFFPAAEYVNAWSKHQQKPLGIAIGSDSHVCTSFTEELRLLEYGQRLYHRKRNVFAGTVVGMRAGKMAGAVPTHANHQSSMSVESGAFLFDCAWRGGVLSAGLGNQLDPKSGEIPWVKDRSFDAVVLDRKHETLTNLDIGKVLSKWIFGGGGSGSGNGLIKGVIRKGEWRVKDGECVGG